MQVYVAGSAVLDHQLEFEQMSVTPGTAVTGQVTVSVSAVFGLAKVAGIGEPQVVMEITITYKTKDGTDAVFGGQVVVPVKLVGSIFWGAGSAELCSGEFGPYTFGLMAGSDAASVSYLRESSPEYEIPDIISTSCLAIDSRGRQMLVWIADTDPKEGSPNPDVYYRYYDGTSWSSSASIIGDASPDELWEMDPAVVFLSGGDALAAWTSNDGSHDLDNLNDIFAAQDIVYSLWDASSASWTAPKHVIDDAEADGIVSLSYDAKNDRIIAAWVHDSNSDHDISTRTEWEIYYSVWNRSADNWTEARALTGDGADFMPAIASDTMGNTFALWVKDEDGEFFHELDCVSEGSNVDYTNLDCEIYYSKWNGDSRTAPAAITESNNETESTPAVAFAASNGDAIAVWVGKQGTSDKLYYSIYRASGDSWSLPDIVNESDYFIEEPKVVVNSADMATVTWRGYDGYDGDLFSSSIDLTASSWSAPKQITRDDKVDWYITTAIGSNDEVMASWTKNDFASKEDLSSPDLSDNVNFAQTDISSAYLTGVYSDTGTYTDGGGLYDYLTVTAEAYIKTAGNYSIIAALYNNSNRIAEVRDSATGLPIGTHTFSLNFPGGFISERGVDGPYQLKNVVLLDKNKSPVQTDFASAPYTTSNYTTDQFVGGAVSFDASEYETTLTTAVISVQDNEMNKDTSARETVNVGVTSTMDTKGISVALVETDINTGIFTGTAGFDTSSSNDTADRILVRHFATIFATYTDSKSNVWRDYALWRTTPAVVSFTYAPENPVVSHEITFDASSSFDPDGFITNYTWDFGDNATDCGKLTTYTYSAPGNYTVTLRVTDDGGAVNYTTKVVSVRELKPSVSIYTDKTSYTAGDKMHLGLDVKNPLDSAQTVRLNAYLEMPTGGTFTLMDTTVTLPAGLDYCNPNFKVFKLRSIPEGTYTWHAILRDVTGIISESTAEWDFVGAGIAEPIEIEMEEITKTFPPITETIEFKD